MLDAERDDLVFKALADATRRSLLDRLFTANALTLTELESQFEMSRFGVMKHLRLLEEANLVVTRRAGRAKLHLLNPIPIRQLHDRWIDKYTLTYAAALTDLKTQLESAPVSESQRPVPSLQVYEIYIKAAPQAIWDAITSPEWTARYGYRGPATYELKAGGSYQAVASAEMAAMGITGALVDGEVLESDPPKKLVQTYRFLFSDAHKQEGFSKITWEIEETQSGFCRLSVTHELDGKPIMASMVSSKFNETGTGGWTWILSDLKSLLETGKSM